MKFCASLALIVFVGLVANSSALPARKRMVYYQQPAQYYAAPQRIMYMQYVQPGRTHARSTQAASALVAGETVATGTYLKDCDHVETDVAAAGPGADGIAAESHFSEDVLGAADAAGVANTHISSSVAEAYPEEPEAPKVQIEVEAEQAAGSDDEAKVPREYNFEAPAAAPEVPANEVAAESELPAPAPIAPVAEPATHYLPAQKKKVIVELDQSAEAEENANAAAAEDDETENAVSDDVEEDEEVVPAVPAVPVAPKYPARVPNARRPAVKKPVKAAGAGSNRPSKPLPAGTFFPIEFGGTAGGAIAIANSFSTGEGGAATSHAIAYGSPEAARARVRPSKFH